MALTHAPTRKSAVKIVKRTTDSHSKSVRTQAVFESSLAKEDRGHSLKQRMDEALKKSDAVRAKLRQDAIKVVA